jgi:hypothetical protein
MTDSLPAGERSASAGPAIGCGGIRGGAARGGAGRRGPIRTE